jgi:xeroderma pigmentosum group C-complementing protein
VPKNTYGNLDVYVPSMIPNGGVHIPGKLYLIYSKIGLTVADPEASRAARILAVDYADAVTGFEFRGRHGTAIIKGIVAAVEYKDAIEAVMEGFRDEQAEAEEEMRSLAALRMWKRFMVGLRIKERVDGYEIEGEEAATEPVEYGSGMESEEYIDDGGGGFLPE